MSNKYHLNLWSKTFPVDRLQNMSVVSENALNDFILVFFFTREKPWKIHLTVFV